MIRGYIEPNYGSGTSKKSRRERRIRQDLFNDQEGKCFWCGEKMQMNPLVMTIHGYQKANKAFATFEHLLPKSQGGKRNKENIVLAHGKCNNKRGRRKWPHDPIYGNKLEV